MKITILPTAERLTGSVCPDADDSCHRFIKGMNSAERSLFCAQCRESLRILDEIRSTVN